MLRIYDRPFGFRFLTKSTSKHFVFAYAPADTLMVCDAVNIHLELTVTCPLPQRGRWLSER